MKKIIEIRIAEEPCEEESPEQKYCPSFVGVAGAPARIFFFLKKRRKVGWQKCNRLVFCSSRQVREVFLQHDGMIEMHTLNNNNGLDNKIKYKENSRTTESFWRPQ